MPPGHGSFELAWKRKCGVDIEPNDVGTIFRSILSEANALNLITREPEVQAANLHSCDVNEFGAGQWVHVTIAFGSGCGLTGLGIDRGDRVGHREQTGILDIPKPSVQFACSGSRRKSACSGDVNTGLIRLKNRPFENGAGTLTRRYQRSCGVRANEVGRASRERSIALVAPLLFFTLKIRWVAFLW